MVLLMSLILCCAALAFSLRTYLRDTRALYAQHGQELAEGLAGQGQEENWEEDSQFRQALQKTEELEGVSFAAVVLPQENGLEILLCSGDRMDQGLVALGELWMPGGLGEEHLEELLSWQPGSREGAES